MTIAFRNETRFMTIFFSANSARINTSPDIAYRQAVPLHDDRLHQQRGRIGNLRRRISNEKTD